MTNYNDIYVVKTPGALGDAVMSTALLAPFNKAGLTLRLAAPKFMLPLFDGLDIVPYAFGDARSVPGAATDALYVDTKAYLERLCHRNKIPISPQGEFLAWNKFSQLPQEEKDMDYRFGHLSEWIGYSVFEQTGIPMDLSSADVKLNLTREEMQFGADEVKRISRENGNLPLVIASVYSAAKNKNLNKSTVSAIAKGLEGKAVVGLMGPVAESQYVPGTINIAPYPNIRHTASLLSATNALFGVDSAHYHIANAVLQGSSDEALSAIDNASSSKTLLVAGSSLPSTILYLGSSAVVPKNIGNVCAVGGFCGEHGYGKAGATARFSMPFHDSGNPKDMSACFHQDYPAMETAPCMAAIQPDQVISELEDILR